MPTLRRKLEEALGLLKEQKDEPVKPKPEGKNKKSSDGAHRFDSPVEFIEMNHDDQFKTKGDYKSI